MSIDENRADFARVPWNLPAGTQDIGADGSSALPFKQVWFAGNHSDIGGGYSENESRLSDIAMHWMVEQATEIPQPILVDRSLLRLFPWCAGPQHDEVKAGVNWVPRLFYRWIAWKVGARVVPVDAPLHPTVIERFGLESVLQYDVTVPYRRAASKASGHEAVLLKNCPAE